LIGGIAFLAILTITGVTCLTICGAAFTKRICVAIIAKLGMTNLIVVFLDFVIMIMVPTMIIIRVALETSGVVMRTNTVMPLGVIIITISHNDSYSD
jgi:hypothetical protein